MTYHLETLRLRLSDELDRLTRAKTDDERKLCWVAIASIEKEIRGKIELQVSKGSFHA